MWGRVRVPEVCWEFLINDTSIMEASVPTNRRRESQTDDAVARMTNRGVVGDQVNDFDVDHSDPMVKAGPPGSGGDATRLTKISANLVPRAVAALQSATQTTGDNATDTLNRSIQLYAHIITAIGEGKLVFVEDPRTGARERLVLL
jgi:hypothetical protein